VIIFGCFLAAASWLASPAPTSRQARRFLAPGLRDQQAYFYGGLVVITGLYLLISPGHNLRSLITVLVIVALIALGIRELRRMTMSEFPDIEPWTGMTKLRAATGRAWKQLIGSKRSKSAGDKAASADQSQVSPTAVQPRPIPQARSAERAPVQTDADDFEVRIARLERLASLHERGILTDEELAAEKARILGEGGDLA
jgi:hypothetical protein